MELIRKIFIGLIIYGFFLIFLALFLKDVISFDEYLFLAINSLTNPYLLLFFEAITYLGSFIFWILLIVLFWFKNKKKLSVHLLFAFILDAIFLIIFKWVFLRPRPFKTFQLGFDIFDISPSFPSGHSQQVFSGMFILSHYYKKYEALFYVLAILVSLSRIFLGLHYPLDVLIGAINGIIVGMIALKIPTKKFL